MKKFIITIVILLSIFFDTKAQYQSIFGQNSTEWIFEWTNLFGWAQDTAYVEKDTVVFGYNWKKIRVSPTTGVVQNALVREDTTIGKIWYKYIGNDYPDTLEKLLFDYSLQVGDTFDVSNSGAMTSTLENTVDSVYYVNGAKHIRFKGKYYGNENYLFIEGISGILGVFWKQYGTLLLANYLLCSYKDGVQTFYQNKKYNGNCNVWWFWSTDNPEKINTQITLFPNPAKSVLNIKTDNIKYKVTLIELINVYGSIVISYKNPYSVDISNLPAGTYIIKLTFDNQFKTYKLFQKQ